PPEPIAASDLVPCLFLTAWVVCQTYYHGLGYDAPPRQIARASPPSNVGTRLTAEQRQTLGVAAGCPHDATQRRLVGAIASAVNCVSAQVATVSAEHPLSRILFGRVENWRATALGGPVARRGDMRAVSLEIAVSGAPPAVNPNSYFRA